MTRKDKFLILFVILFVVFADQLTKMWALGLDDMVEFGYLRFFPTYNKSAFLGIFAKLPQNLKQVGLATFGSVFVIFFGVIQMLIPERLIGLRLGFAVLLGGMLSNVADRLDSGQVVDFIIFGTKDVIYSIMNLSDLFQYAGLIIIVFNVIVNFTKLWDKDNKRKRKWVDPPFQRRFILFNFSMLASISLVLFVLSFSFLKVTLNENMGFNSEVSEQILMLFLRLYLIVNAVLFLCYFVICLIVSHRIAGPVYAFRKYINDILNHTHLQDFNVPLVLRKNDSFEELIELSKAIKDRLKSLKKD